MMTFPELLSNSERTLGPLTCHLQQNGIRVPTVDHTEGGQANVAKILQLCQRHSSMYCTILHVVCMCTRVQYVYCTVSSFDDHTHHGTSMFKKKYHFQ